jgi:hypothetical protein
MGILSISALISILILAVVLYLVFILIKWAVGEFGLPAIIVRVAGIVLGLIFLIRLLALLGIK